MTRLLRMKCFQSFQLFRFKYSKRPILKSYQCMFFIVKDKFRTDTNKRIKLFLIYEYFNLYVFQVEYGKTKNSEVNDSKHSTELVYY